ncbi:hypothetical protein SRS16CHR_01187 [Variovorax sp. SRS16]|uniref:hypothetical protein n=1 Tax=Variovorax sp. SRS16 TaxID=282217 RepID=UPI0013179579|nr:hypothetical protein [Variovorax sp. SRS16]VTU14623.1 hypothetical protein SRS16CHR_01187 [Variovorax sp. SRS16]
MTPAKLWLQIFLAGFAVIVALLAVTLTTPVPYGDLSRIGLMSDRDFGWKTTPPHVDPEYLRAVPVTQADILVIGDSFSMTNRWQSVLTKEGYRVTTIFWGQLDERICDDLDGWLDLAGFRGKLVILESVERLLAGRLDNTQTCAHMRVPFDAKTKPFIEPPAEVPGFALNWNAKLSSGWHTFWNTRRAETTDDDNAISGYWTKARSVPDGCTMFSNRLCNKALFFGEDDDNGELTPKNAEQMRSITQAHRSRSIMWMVIPNKTTVYVAPDRSKDFVTALLKDGLGPDLFSFALDEKRKIRDFFLPNDTHISMQGQLVLGARMLEAVRKILPAPPGKAS